MNPRRWFIHTVTRRRRTGVDSEADPTYGAQDTFKARVEKKRSIVRNQQGEEVVAGSVLVTDALVSYDDTIWLPSIAGEPADDVTSDDAGRSPLSFEQATDKRGRFMLTRVYFA